MLNKKSSDNPLPFLPNSFPPKKPTNGLFRFPLKSYKKGESRTFLSAGDLFGF